MSGYILIIIFFLFTVSSLDAAIYKGQRVFMKECMSCHKICQEFIAKKTQEEWLSLMKDKGQPLSKLHLNSEDAKESWEYFKSKKYIKKSKHLKQFLVEYAKDSGKVPACN